jgi:hypothetical protein
MYKSRNYCNKWHYTGLCKITNGSRIHYSKYYKMYQKFNINPNFFRQTTIKTSQKYFEANITLEQNILVVIFNHWHFYFYIHHVLCLHVTNILIHNLSMTKSPVSIFSVAIRGIPNRDLFNIIVWTVLFYNYYVICV